MTEKSPKVRSLNRFSMAWTVLPEKTILQTSIAIQSCTLDSEMRAGFLAYVSLLRGPDSPKYMCPATSSDVFTNRVEKKLQHALVSCVTLFRRLLCILPQTTLSCFALGVELEIAITSLVQVKVCPWVFERYLIFVCLFTGYI